MQSILYGYFSGTETDFSLRGKAHSSLQILSYLTILHRIVENDPIKDSVASK